MRAKKTRKKPKVLLVETSGYMRGLLKLVVNLHKKQVFELHIVDSGQKALELIGEDEQFDAVVFDLNGWLWLPSFFSFEAAEKIRRLNDKIAIIASVCCDSCFDPQRCKEIGMYKMADDGFSTNLNNIESALAECSVI